MSDTQAIAVKENDENPGDAEPTLLINDEQAAAILLLLFSEEQSAEILARLEPDEVKKISEIMYSVSDIGADHINHVLDVFVTRASSRTTIGYKSEQQIEKILKIALGDQRADTMLKKVAPKKQNTAITALKWMDPVEISLLIEEEHPQISALVLSFLEAEIAANVLQLLPEKDQDDILFRLATLGPVSEEALMTISQLLDSQGEGAAIGSEPPEAGTMGAAAIINNFNKQDSQRIIKGIKKRDKEIAQQIEDEMFIFADLIRLDPKDLGNLIRSIEGDVMVPALKGASEELRDKIFSCMSSRAAQSIQDEIDQRPMPMSEVVVAQKQVIAIAKKLAESGDIVIGAGGDEYV